MVSASTMILKINGLKPVKVGRILSLIAAQGHSYERGYLIGVLIVLQSPCLFLIIRILN
jgi:hypothetical protein